MKFTKSLLFTISLLLTNLSFSAPTAGAYITDEQDFFVSGNKVNEALERVNLLLCYLANTKPADFVNKETYIATIFEEDCAFGKASGDDQSKASQGKSGSQGKKNKKAENKKKQGNTAYVKITQADGSSPMLGNVWIQLKSAAATSGGPTTLAADGASSGPQGGGGDGLPFDATVYLKYEQTASASATSKFGDFKMNFSLYADAKAVADGFMAMSTGGPPINIQGAAELTAVDDFGKTQKEKIEAQNFSLGHGYLEANGQTVTFREAIMGTQEITITFSDTGASGVYSHSSFDDTWATSPSNASGSPELNVNYAFEIKNAANGNYYCEKALSATGSVFEQFIAADGFYDFADPNNKGATEGTSLTGATVALNATSLGANPAETCYDLDKSNSFINVFQYGVYDSDGTRHGEALGSFPIRAEYSGGDDIYGWADYWGVWVDYYAQEAGVNPTTLTWKRDDGQSGVNFKCSTTGCQLTKNHLEVTKFSTSYRSLDSIHKIRLDFYQPWEEAAKTAWAGLTGSTTANGGSACTYANLDAVNNNACFWSYLGYWDKDAGTGNNGAIVLTHGMKWGKNNPEVDINDITIDGSAYVTAMTVNGYVREVGAWSPDVWTYFQIPGAAFSNANHGSVSPGIGIKDEKVDRISIAQLKTDLAATDIGGNPADRLVCINLCLMPNLFNARLGDAVGRVSDNDTENDNLYNVNYESIWDSNHIFHDFDPGAGQQFGYLDGIAISDATHYIISSSDKLYYKTETAANEMTVTTANQSLMASATASLKEPVQYKLYGMQVKRPDWTATDPYAKEYISWSARSGFLVPSTASTPLPALECEKNGSDYVVFDGDHPRYTGNATKMNQARYCYERIERGAISTYYEIGIMTEGTYQLEESGTKVVIQQPKTLELDTTQWTDSQKTAAGITSAKGNLELAEKNYRLYFEGFGNLFNIPGGFFNTCTGQYVGDYISSWSDCYRWVSKFQIPDGAELIDNSSGSAVSLYAKRLSGDQFLASKSISGTRDYTAIQTANPLANTSNLKDMGPNGTATNKIGGVPTLLRNSGKPSVIMGKIKETTDQLATVPSN